MIDITFTPDPFDRRIVGMAGQVLLRVNRGHEQAAREAIARRPCPAWSLAEPCHRLICCPIEARIVERRIARREAA